uniref:RING-type domain-containing protein n=2 Tax=Kalanchoe fedtschenkoi TaxID=63787 RepID=A0A7N0VA66_KALFE
MYFLPSLIMASMVAKSGGGDCFQAEVSSVSDKANRNKRKFRADISQCDSTNVDSFLENNFPHQLLAEEPDGIPSNCVHGVCKVCGHCEPVSLELELGIPGTAKKESSLYIPETTDWDESAESELQELVLKVMDATFKSAIKKIVDCGYSENVATKALMRPGLCYGSKDTLSNIIDNSLAFLQTSQDLDRSIKYCFKDLSELENYLLAEFVCVLQTVKPIFSPGEALWYLLVFDIDVSHACFVISGQYKLIEEGHTKESFPKSPKNQLSSHNNRFDLNLPAPSMDSESELPISLVIPKLKEPEALAVPDRKDMKKAEMQFSVKAVDQSVSTAGTHKKLVTERQLCGISRPYSVGTFKNDSSLDKKRPYADKTLRKRGPKGAHKTGKMFGVSSHRRTTFSRLPLPAVSRSAISCATEERHSFVGMKREPTQAPVASQYEINNCNYNGRPTEDIKVRPGTQDVNAEIIFRLTKRSQVRKDDLKEWTEWANTKVLQATQRLLKHKPELNILRQEKVEMAKLEQEKQSLKENTAKKLSELENAMYKASEKVKAANSAYKGLEAENAALRQELEVAQSQAAKYDANRQLAIKRDRERLTSTQSCLKQRDSFQLELDAEKHKHAQTQQELRQATVILSRFEAKWEKESKANEELLLQAASIREEIEQVKASGKSKEEAINLKAESTLQKYKDDMQELEREISKLRLKLDSSKIAALRRGIGEGHVTATTGMKKSFHHQKPQNSIISKNSLGSQKINGGSFAKRHRECVMCLEEEMSVVFLPCAHQVLCAKCNEQHEKKGMKDCPSCRSAIVRRIAVRYVMP